MDSSDEDDETTSSAQPAPSSARDDESDELASFRRQWQLELLQQSAKKIQNDTSVDNETKAKTFFSQGIAAEQRGNHYQAISYYRLAIQLVPDIEHKMCYSDPVVITDHGEQDIRTTFDVVSSELAQCFQNMSLASSCCEPEKPSTETHISSLPVEIITNILHWTISSELHLHCLEQFSMVCKGFYLLARQPAIWRCACVKLWGNECAPTSYGGSWRHMFITKPHPLFHGVYISECSYVRQGEASIDRYYRPFHTVVFYRYLRFYSDGHVLYLTSPDDPATCVSKIKGHGNYQSLLSGHYSVSEVDGERKLSVVVHAHCCQQSSPSGSNRKFHHRNYKLDVTHDQNFHMEFFLRGRRFNQLTWVDHYCYTFNRKTGTNNVSHFEMNHKYTPFWFSRVRSYTNNTSGILC